MSDDLAATMERYYLEAMARIGELARADADRLATTPVPACPGWSAHDLIAHVAGNVEDALAGKLTGIPSDDYTAEQVRLRRDRSVDELLDTWADQAPGFAAFVTQAQIWPAVIDVVSHEQDLRGALGRPGERDSDAIAVSVTLIGRSLRPPRRVTITTETGEWTRGPHDVEPLRLRSTSFELFRILLGRRSRAQIAALDWSDDPEAVLDHICVFGPAARDLVE